MLQKRSFSNFVHTTSTDSSFYGRIWVKYKVLKIRADGSKFVYVDGAYHSAGQRPAFQLII